MTAARWTPWSCLLLLCIVFFLFRGFPLSIPSKPEALRSQSGGKLSDLSFADPPTVQYVKPTPGVLRPGQGQYTDYSPPRYPQDALSEPELDFEEPDGVGTVNDRRQGPFLFLLYDSI